jgi:lipopolysaccharide/colanic/teichoic acid biosynthesis glycosyltransferase
MNSAAAYADEATWTFPVWKRALDLTLILLTMPIWLTVMILLAVGIKCVSPGPVFFYQERVGFGGCKFWCIKFRSMKVNADTKCHEGHLRELLKSDRPMTKLDSRGDSRLIPLGRILRATGLDELPQIFNVLKGEMSLVGPRPCTPNEFDIYEPWQKERVNAPPGLTGFWQVNGKNKTTFTEMIAMDIHYSIMMSPGMDIAILLKTFPAVLGQVLETRTGAAARCSAQMEPAVEAAKY